MSIENSVSWLEFLKYGWAVFLVFVGMQRKTNLDLHARISKLKDSHVDHRMSSFKDFVTKSEHTEANKEIKAGFNRIMDRLDNIADKLDGKMDK